MIMEKGISSVEVLPSKSSQVTAVKVVVKEPETKQTQRGKRVGFVLVHAGAGYHSESKAKEYKHVCKRACQKAIEKLQAGALATDAVTAALIELEDSPFTNAGMGSNLNLLGEIECDASIMDGKSLNFGAVGALSGIKNPVSVANRLLCEGQKGKLSAGRIPPCFLVGEGAFRWAVDHGIPACPPGFSLAAFKRNKRKLELAEKVETDLIQLKKRRQSNEKGSRVMCRTCGRPSKANDGSRGGDQIELYSLENDSGTLDTVGAVVVDQEGNVAAAVSSGGLALKHPGRVGQAALYGCGCWAENTGAHTPYSTAVSTSGCGEHLVRTILARECSCALQTEDAHQALLETMQNKFIGSPFLASEDGVLGGVIVLRSCRCSAEPELSQEKPTLLVEFLWSHTTESMCVGYMSAQDGKAKTHISRLPPGAVAGQSVAIEGGVCRLESPES
ncbi:threonine aspartase 1 isoform X4 [Centrocercus urophasianus]|uniref:threonine aspartase 1 isoform X4 n=1 Tax=Centrocercus urophasianus TaxID=9002 RepID=UPI001C645302|nr:threonine aspartase 1 isoform X4 [Centrocercus urophasianus]XP_042751247.1 threonine aspartase 1 isoform X4 [Lagopus leucura]XP_048792006.1 threonine aspartase 1 isoform X5 [Lagopus muta]